MVNDLQPWSRTCWGPAEIERRKISKAIPDSADLLSFDDAAAAGVDNSGSNDDPMAPTAFEPDDFDDGLDLDPQTATLEDDRPESNTAESDGLHNGVDQDESTAPPAHHQDEHNVAIFSQRSVVANHPLTPSASPRQEIPPPVPQANPRSSEQEQHAVGIDQLANNASQMLLTIPGAATFNASPPDLPPPESPTNDLRLPAPLMLRNFPSTTVPPQESLAPPPAPGLAASHPAPLIAPPGPLPDATRRHAVSSVYAGSPHQVLESMALIVERSLAKGVAYSESDGSSSEAYSPASSIARSPPPEPRSQPPRGPKRARDSGADPNPRSAKTARKTKPSASSHSPSAADRDQQIIESRPRRGRPAGSKAPATRGKSTAVQPLPWKGYAIMEEGASAPVGLLDQTDLAIESRLRSQASKKTAPKRSSKTISPPEPAGRKKGGAGQKTSRRK
ncbi:hypothetical protein CYLTODRAFT_148102 [Cylindrobasidium torrendii FP15055 ss-10]|uniref:Uncharacterized protein n=1 Tax=Cylindrobasidium torrendii FP15055 ss-10 TaxID=1314674 RepID=A0A0D7BLE9_9AGAR|nr:hypothetical protein CYLTODRAFT_148102 [Cylindrobasidium torrendii FP15055 ss-10]